MNLKKYLMIDDNRTRTYGAVDTIKLKIKTGITSDELKDSVQKEWTPRKSDRVYFFPGCSVPRFKVREKWNVTIKPEYASAAFISTDGLKGTEDMFNVFQSYQTIDGEYFGQWLEEVYSAQHHLVVKYKSLLMNCEDEVLIHSDLLYVFTWNTPKDALTKGHLREFQEHRVHKGLEEEDTPLPVSNHLNFYVPVKDSNLSKIKCPIYSQDAILKLLNEDNIVINEKKYDELRLMANSSDEENIILVMELMANANYKKSFVYLLLLLKEFNSKISARRKEINHVNFKALLHFLDLEPKKLDGITIEQMMTGMKKHKQFTRSNLQRVSYFFTDDHNTNTHLPNNRFETTHFTAGPILKAGLEDELDDYKVEEEDEVPIPEEPEPDENFNL
jgi:hypothetical protein